MLKDDNVTTVRLSREITITRRQKHLPLAAFGPKSTHCVQSQNLM